MKKLVFHIMKPPGFKSYINLHNKLLKTRVTYIYIYISNINKKREELERWKAKGQVIPLYYNLKEIM